MLPNLLISSIQSSEMFTRPTFVKRSATNKYEMETI